MTNNEPRWSICLAYAAAVITMSCSSAADGDPTTDGANSGHSNTTASAGGSISSGDTATSAGDTASSTGAGAAGGAASTGSGAGSAEECMGVPGQYPYFDALISNPAMLFCYDMRSPSSVDVLETAESSARRYPVVYDEDADAMLQRIDPEPFVEPGGGSPSAEQKWASIDINGTSMLMTWDFRMSDTCAHLGTGYIGNHKAWRIDYGSGAFFLTWKTDYAKGANTGNGLAEMFMSSQSKDFLGPGTTRDGKEILLPRLGEFYIQANTWTRYWFFIEGKIGGGPGGEVVYFSTWAADETREPVRLYDRLPMYTPPVGLNTLRFEFNASATSGLNDMMRIWNRNLVVLQGQTLEQVEALLEKP
jgi:hypothetical protein